MIDENRQSEIWDQIWHEASQALEDNIGREVDSLNDEIEITRIAFNLACSHLANAEYIMQLREKKAPKMDLSNTKSDFYKGYAESLEKEIGSLKDEINRLKSNV